jgi:DNA-binding GntR family transcriptional regulator
MPKDSPDPEACTPRACARDRLRDEIVRRILNGDYEAGTHLKELALAREFGVSQAPVREALRELEMLGLVASERYCGTRVMPCGSADLREAYELKAVIEQRAAQLAPPCSVEDLAALEADVQCMRTALDDADLEAYSVASLAFHRRIVVLSGNRQFLRSWESMHWDVRSRVAVKRFHPRLAINLARNQQVVEALRAGDGDLAGQHLRLSIEETIAGSDVDFRDATNRNND